MTKLEMLENIRDFIYKTLDDGMSWTSFLKVDKFFEDLKKQIKEEQKW